MNGEQAYRFALANAPRNTDGSIVEEALVEIVARAIDFDAEKERLGLAQRVVSRRKRPGQTEPAPRPLPNPGPPPAPAVGVDRVTGVPLCEHGDDVVACQLRHSTPTQPGPGPKPEGPSHPTPTGPGRPPTLAHLVGNATKILDAAIDVLGRQWDPASGPRRDDPWDPDGADVYLGRAVADIRSALRELATLTTLIPARQDTNSASLPGGPPNHPDHIQGEGLTPGLDAGARRVPEGSVTTPPGRDAGADFTPPGTRPFVMYSSVVNAAFARQHRMGRRP